jgi:multiple sugar transport system ATP-binding protein
MGAETYIYLVKGKSNIVARVNGTSKAKAGDTLKIALDTSKIHVFDKETENTII